jgi:DNA (cytosine-5)-methyltransferase 1
MRSCSQLTYLEPAATSGAHVTEYAAVSLFSGCGGFCEGASLAGLRILAAVEWDRFAAETYRHNFPDIPLFEADIAGFLNRDSPDWQHQKARFVRVRRGAVDVVFGGPPCQGYSQIGTRDLDDPRNGLYREYVRIVETLQPRVFVMENVPNMLLLRKGVFRDQVLAAFAEAGYTNCDVRVLSASDYGVPQLRRRAFFVGVRDGLGFDLPIGDWLDAVAASERRPETTVRMATADLPEKVGDAGAVLPYPRSSRANWVLDELRLDREGDFYSSQYKLGRSGSKVLHNHHTKEIQERRRALIALLKPGLKGDSLPEKVWNGLRPEKWRRLHPDKPAYTILAQMHRDLSEWVHPDHQRWITVREAARLQSFHDGFVFKSSEWQMLKQIGNAVPPLLGRVVSLAAIKTLEYLDGDTDSALLRSLEIPLRLRLAI